MSLFQYNTLAVSAGSSSPYSAAFESLAAQTLQGVLDSQFVLTFPEQPHFYWDGAGNQVMIDRPRAELTLRWLFASGLNESAIGLVAAPSGAISALAAANDERNYYLRINQDGQDALDGIGAGAQMLALGNAVLTRYELAAAVGQPTTVSATVEGLNLLIQPTGGSGQPLPSIHKQSGTAVTGRYTLSSPTQSISSYTEAAPSSLLLTFNTGCALGVALSGQNSCPVDSFSFSLELPRANVQDLGWAYPDQRPVQWPATLNIQAEASLSQFQLDALTRPLCDSGQSFTVGFRSSCSVTDDLQFRFNGAKLLNQSIAATVGNGVAKVSLGWSAQIYDINRRGPTDPNIFIHETGVAYTSIVFPQVDYVSGSAPLTFNLSTGCFLFVARGPGLLSGNSVFVTDETATIVVRCAATDGSDTQDLTVTVG